MTYEPSKRPTIDEILEKPIVEERMKLYLKENKFNKNEATEAINNYIKEFRKIEKDEDEDEDINLCNIKIEDNNDDNLDVSHTSAMTDPQKKEKIKYEFAKQLTLINEILNRAKTINPNKKNLINY